MLHIQFSNKQALRNFTDESTPEQSEVRNQPTKHSTGKRYLFKRMGSKVKMTATPAEQQDLL